VLTNANLLGALVAHVIYLSSVLVFVSRLLVRSGPGSWLGVPTLLMALPLGYLLWTAPSLQRPTLYYVQVGVMLLWILALFVLDYVLKIEFRQSRWMVIGFVTLYFAGLGGMIGVAALAGRAWMQSAIVFFFVTLMLAFVQRAVTGY
jgi:hypothetical protein